MKFTDLCWHDSRLERITVEYDTADIIVWSDVLDRNVCIHCTGLAGLTELCIWDDTILYGAQISRVTEPHNDFLKKLFSAYDPSYDYGNRILDNGLYELKFTIINDIPFYVYCQKVEVIDLVPGIVLAVMRLDADDFLVMRRSDPPRYFADDVDIEWVSQGKRFLVHNDSFSRAAFPELTGAVRQIMIAPCGFATHAISATCDRGGFELELSKITEDTVELRVIQTNVETNTSKLLHSKRFSLSALLDIKEEMERLWENREREVGPDFMIAQ